MNCECGNSKGVTKNTLVKIGGVLEEWVNRMHDRAHL